MGAIKKIEYYIYCSECGKFIGKQLAENKKELLKPDYYIICENCKKKAEKNEIQ